MQKKFWRASRVRRRTIARLRTARPSQPTTFVKHQHRRNRGYSLLEILVVLAIIALITSATALALFKFIPEARIKATLESARVIRNAVATYQTSQSSGECPTIETLVSSNTIDEASKTVDAWDQPFDIQCLDDGRIHVTSGGPDKRLGGADDIRVPDPPAKAAVR